ncbi:MAG: hypothetical protein SCALA701_34550 [Candidatus Scalindua sp.]|nr:MAG: hypothetical protein SCALA701_34550 [Candidatus Scalindua sp.]
MDTAKIKIRTFPQVKEHLLSQERKIASLKSNVDITLTTPETNGPFSCKGVFVLQKPEKIRVIGFKLATTVFNMLSDGENFWFYIPKQKTVYTGKCNAKRVVHDNTYLFPDDIAVLLDHEKLFERRSAFMETWPTFWLIHIFDKNGELFIPYGRLTVSRIDSTITELTLFQDDSQVKVQASFNDYVSIEDYTLPKEVEINWPESDTTLKITFKDPSVNETLKPKVFQFKKPRKAEIIQVN